MTWQLAHRADPRCAALADRHYNRQHIGSPQFMPPGRCLVLYREGAVWGSSFPYARFVKHAWAGAWVNSLFRNESEALSSTLIREAVAATRWYYGEPPPLGIITFVDAKAVRHKRDPGRCYLKAGFVRCGAAKDGKLAFQLLPAAMPDAAPPLLALLPYMAREKGIA